MREIKFRGKRIDNIKHERKEFVYGSYLYINNYEYDWNGNRSTNKKEAHFIIGEDDRNIIVDKETVGQYTGLKDKNGTEIYEGDIVKEVFYKFSNDEFGPKAFYENISKVVYKGRAFKYDFIKTNEIKMPEGFRESFIEVIGNIHDNPELLEGEKV